MEYPQAKQQKQEIQNYLLFSGNHINTSIAKLQELAITITKRPLVSCKKGFHDMMPTQGEMVILEIQLRESVGRGPVQQSRRNSIHSNS